MCLDPSIPAFERCFALNRSQYLALVNSATPCGGVARQHSTRPELFALSELLDLFAALH
jgi:hypothetical protein